MDDKTVQNLINKAMEIAKKNNCCKWSNYTVGCALLDAEGNIWDGFNVENHGIQSICAERVTFCKAFTNGAKDFKCIAVVGKKLNESKFEKTLPCGYCRQFMSEYVDEDFIVYTYDEKTNQIYTYTIKELLPESFNL